jgi:hypothetical protein
MTALEIGSVKKFRAAAIEVNADYDIAGHTP